LDTPPDRDESAPGEELLQGHPLPKGRPALFRATVHGVAFGDRAARVEELRPGDRLNLMADPTGEEPEAVWVHSMAGDPLGHLPDEIGKWLAPWLRGGGTAGAVALKVGGADVPSWRRVLVEVHCRTED
jgi:hypothetical protein